MSLLAQARPDDLEAAFRELTEPPRYRLVRGPEIGLVMVRGRAGGTGSRFNMGEMTVARCSVELASGTVGHGYVGGRNRRQAEIAAVFDALLQDSATCADLETSLIAPLERAQRRRRQEAAARSATARVEFFTLVRGED